jgi:hypothetical protein
MKFMVQVRERKMKLRVIKEWKAVVSDRVQKSNRSRKYAIFMAWKLEIK